MLRGGEAAIGPNSMRARFSICQFWERRRGVLMVEDWLWGGIEHGEWQFQARNWRQGPEEPQAVGFAGLLLSLESNTLLPKPGKASFEIL